MRVTTEQALAWRLRRQALDHPADEPVTSVADRMLATRGWPFDAAALSVAIRRIPSDRGALARAADRGDVIRAYALRGGSYLFTPAIAAVLLAVRTAAGHSSSQRFQRQGGFTLDDWGPLRATLREFLADGPRTRGEIGDHLASIPALSSLGVAARTGAGSDTLYKPLHWWGDICFGPTLDGQATFRLSQSLPGSPDIDDAGRQAILWYLRAYGPATIDNLRYFFAAGLSVPGRRLTGWLTDLDDAITSVDVDGLDAYAATADLNELAATQPSSDIRLIPGYDPWVLGPGTADAWVVPRVRRADATRGANLILRGGGVIGTWKFARGEIHTNIYPDADPVSTADLNNSTARTLALLTA